MNCHLGDDGSTSPDIVELRTAVTPKDAGGPAVISVLVCSLLVVTSLVPTAGDAALVG